MMDDFDWMAALIVGIAGVVGGGLVLISGIIVAKLTGNEFALLLVLWVSGFACGFISRVAYIELREVGR